MIEMRNHVSPRYLNARLRIVGPLSLPQTLGIGLALAAGAGLWWLLGLAPAFAAGGFVGAVLRMTCCGVPAGLLALLLYALADDRREPFVRQAVLYPLRRHTYLTLTKEHSKEHTHGFPRFPVPPTRITRITRIARIAAAAAARRPRARRDAR